jgi:hypothetical protein
MVRFGGKPALSKENSSTYEMRHRSASGHINDAEAGDFSESSRGHTKNAMAISCLVDDTSTLVSHRQNKSLSVNSTLSSMHLKVPDDEMAQCFFLANFTLHRTANKMSHLAFIVPLLKSDSDVSPLNFAFSAVSFAALAGQPNSKALLSKAKFSYVQALKQINVALADPKLAKRDSLMATTLLLAVYEVNFLPLGLQ